MIDTLVVLYGLLCLSLVVGGSQILNNGGSGAWVLAALAALVAYIPIVIAFRRKIHAATLPIAIFIFSLSVLLSWALRSSYVFGYDINQEFHVFQLANTAKHWTISSDRSPYNACLSITILPTVLSTLTSLSGELFFKVIAQGIFALVPVAIYSLARRVFAKNSSNTFIAFLAAIIFASQTWFIEQAPALVRQEVALLFFSVFLIALFSRAKSYRVLSVLFGLMVVFSHYSTAYVMLALIGVYLSLYALRFKRSQTKLISARLFLILLMTAFLWQFQATDTKGNFTTTLKQTATSLPQVFSSEDIGSTEAQLSFSNNSINDQSHLNKLYKSTTREYREQFRDILYPPSDYASYKPIIIPTVGQESLPLLKGMASNVVLDIWKISKLIVIDLLPVIGLATIVIWSIRNKKENSLSSYGLLSLASMMLIALMLILPLLKTDYNITRLWLQALVVFAPLIVLGGLSALNKLPRVRYQILAILSAIFLAGSSGLLTYASTGSAQSMFKNYSGDYDHYFTTTGETLAAGWLSHNKSTNPVYADQLASLKLMSYGGITYTHTALYPSTITTNSYVYLSRTNLNGITFVSPNSQGDPLLTYKFSTQFLQSYKDKVYTDGDSQIYH